MARAPDERASKAHDLYKQGKKLIDIANELGLPPGTVRRWKSTYKWDSERSEMKTSVRKRKGGQPNNKNAVGNCGGGPPGNKKAEKYGFFSKYLPEETKEIFDSIEQSNPLDLLWHQIQIAYAAIIRAQKIAYVKDREDHTIIKSGYKDGNVCGEDYAVQTAIDKQAKFMQAQARAQGELRSLIKQYDEMLHNNSELATEEQKLRIQKLRLDIKAQTGENKDNEGIQDFIRATKPTQEDINALFEDEVTDNGETQEE